MYYRVVRGSGGRQLRQRIDALDRICFPEDYRYPYIDQAMWWFVIDENNCPVAYAGLRYWRHDDYGFLCRAGVLPEARGKGLQRKLIRVRIAAARLSGWEGVYTYTSADNIHSMNNLIACGFRLYDPAEPWAGRKDVLYWYKETR